MRQCNSLSLCLFAGCLTLACPASLHAAEAETEVMGTGKAQLEFKAAITRDASIDLRQQSNPFLARIGLTTNTELRLATEGHISETSAGITSHGWSDLNIGVRVKTDEGTSQNETSSTAWQFELGLPSGSAAFKAPSTSYAIKYTKAWALSGTVTLGVMPGITRQKNSQHHWFNAPFLALTLSKNWTPELTLVTELVGNQFASLANGGNISTYKLGSVLSLNPSTELETVYSRGLTTNTPKHNLELSLNFKF